MNQRSTQTQDSLQLSLPQATDGIVPFEVHVPEPMIEDLKSRLSRTRWPEKETYAGWSSGVPLAKAQQLVEHWGTHYDWREFEARLNGYPQFRTLIDGLGVHFIHVRSPHRGALPILLTHGWPGSVAEFLATIGPLTDPVAHGGEAKDAFDVVLPSLPGFGFSDKPTQGGWNVPRIARAWAALMARLGYTRWVAQGGDWGSAVTHAMARQRPTGLLAAHVNWPMVYPEKLPENPTADEQRAIEARDSFRSEGIGYWLSQSTRPQTMGYSFADSPSGQAMWIYEKFHAWTDNSGNPEDALSIKDMLDNISIYWFTNTAASSARIYAENAPRGPSFSLGPVDLPMAASIFPREIYRAPHAWAKQAWPNLIYWNELDRGGHFAALEQPALFVQELRKAFGGVR